MQKWKNSEQRHASHKAFQRRNDLDRRANRYQGNDTLREIQRGNDGRFGKNPTCSRCGERPSHSYPTVVGYELRSDAPLALWGLTESLCPECREELRTIPVEQIQAFMGR